MIPEDPKALISVADLAQHFNRSQVAIRRAVRRGELPEPIRLLGKSYWSAGQIRLHIEKREKSCNSRR